MFKSIHIKSLTAAMLIAGSGLIAGCATTPDPAVVCSAEWVKPRAARAMKDFKRDTSRTLKTLKKNADRAQGGGKLTAFQTYSMINSVQKLAKKFQNGRGMKDLRILADTCDDPKIVKTAFLDFLDEAGLSQSVKDMFTMIEGFSKPDVTAPDTPKT